MRAPAACDDDLALPARPARAVAPPGILNMIAVPADDPRFTVVVSTPRVAGKQRVWKASVTLCTNEDFAATPALPEVAPARCQPRWPSAWPAHWL